VTSYFFWLGRETEQIMREEEEAMFFRREIEARQLECKPEADGWITIHPKLK